MEKETMKSYAVLTLVGVDAHGLLARASEFVVSHQGNITSDVTCSMGGSVAVVSLCFEFEDDSHQTRMQAMQNGMATLETDTRCACRLHSAVSPSPITRISPDYLPTAYGASVVSDDAPGLLKELSALCKRWGVNIIGHTGESLEGGGDSGKHEYRQLFLVWLPRKTPNGAEFRLKFFDTEFQETVAKKPFNGRSSLFYPVYTLFGRFW
jgi:glycine cleavage system regulatory protein